MRIFKSTMSPGYRFTTFLYIVIMLVMVIQVYSKLDSSSLTSLPYLGAFSLAGLLLYILFRMYGAQITALCVDEDVLIIQKKWGQVVIRREDICGVETKKGTMTDQSLWASNGLFGYIGWVYNRHLGRFYAVANNGNKMLAVRTKDKCYVVSCDEPQAFMALFQ